MTRTRTPLERRDRILRSSGQPRVTLFFPAIVLLALSGWVGYVLVTALAAVTQAVSRGDPLPQLLPPVLTFLGFLLLENLFDRSLSIVGESLQMTSDSDCVYMLETLAEIPPEAAANVDECRAELIQSANDWRAQNGSSAMLDYLMTRLQGLVMLGLGLRIAPVESLVVAGCYYVQSLATAGIIRAKGESGGGSLNPARERYAYLRDLASGRTSPAEVRIFGYSPWALPLAQQEGRLVRAVEAEDASRQERWRAASSMLGAVGMGVAICALTWRVWTGSLSVALLPSMLLVLLRLSFLGPVGEAQFMAIAAVRRLQSLRRARRLWRSTPKTGPSRRIVGGLHIRATYEYPAGFRLAAQCTIPEGKTTVLIGANGCGKSTLLDVLAGVKCSSSDAVATDEEGALSSAALRANSALVRQEFASYPLPVEALVGRRDGDGWRLLNRLGLANSGRSIASSLSGGERQKVAVARALAQMESTRSLLLMDEPTSAMDMLSERYLLEEVRRCKPNATVVCVTHRMSVARCADHVVVLEDGMVVEEGAPVELTKIEGGLFVKFLEAHDSALTIRGSAVGEK